MPAPAPRWRTRVFKVLCVLYAFFWLNVAFSAGPAGGEHALQEFAFRNLFAVVLVIVPAVVQLRRPERKPAAQQQVVLTATAHMLATFVAAYVDPLAYALVAIAIVVGFLHPARHELLQPGRPSRLVVAVAAVIGVALTVFAVDQAGHLAGPRSSYFEDTLVFATGLLLTVLVAALRARGSRIPAWTAGPALAAYGVMSALNPDRLSSWGRLGGIAGVAGAVALIVTSELAERSRQPSDQAS